MRTIAYAAERSRSMLQSQVGSMEDWLNTLELKVAVEVLAPSNISRATQLLNKTNQFNLATRRLTETELLEWASQSNRRIWTFRVSDRFGESGLTGLISVEHIGSEAFIRDFVLSCRVFGRRVEDVMLGIVSDWASATNLTRIVADFIPSPKNKPCLEFLQKSGAAISDGHSFYWDTWAKPFASPSHITIIRAVTPESSRAESIATASSP
jgi:FkbH-like protein